MGDMNRRGAGSVASTRKEKKETPSVWKRRKKENRRNETTNGGRFLDLSIHPGKDGTLFGFRRLSSKYEKKGKKSFEKIL